MARAQAGQREQLRDSLIMGSWAHSHEEQADKRGAQVWRPTDRYTFPEARGRQEVTFLSQGRVVRSGPGPDDRPIEREGTWGWTSANTLRILLDEGVVLIWRIDALDQKRMEVTPIQE